MWASLGMISGSDQLSKVWLTCREGGKVKMRGKQNEIIFGWNRLTCTSVFGLCFLSVHYIKLICYFFTLIVQGGLLSESFFSIKMKLHYFVSCSYGPWVGLFKRKQVELKLLCNIYWLKLNMKIKCNKNCSQFISQFLSCSNWATII